MRRVVTIYALSEGLDDPPRYIGKTVSWLRQRYSSHLYEARKGTRRPVCTWIRKLLGEGKQPVLRWVETVKSDADWQERESYWIAKFRADGARLLNLTDGGEGAPRVHKSMLSRAKHAMKLRTLGARRCIVCDKKFWPKPSQIAKGWGKCCSMVCRDKNIIPGKLHARSSAGGAAAAAKRRAMTHCKRGHRWTVSNAYMLKGIRRCRECRELAKASYLDRQREQHSYEGAG